MQRGDLALYRVLLEKQIQQVMRIIWEKFLGFLARLMRLAQPPQFDSRKPYGDNIAVYDTVEDGVIVHRAVRRRREPSP